MMEEAWEGHIILPMNPLFNYTVHVPKITSFQLYIQVKMYSTVPSLFAFQMAYVSLNHALSASSTLPFPVIISWNTKYI